MGKTKSSKGAKAGAGGSEKPSLLNRFTFSDTEQPFELDLLDLTVEEKVMVEEFYDKPWNQLAAEGWLLGSIKSKVFFAHLARRRKEPSFTYADALEFEATLAERGDDEGGDRPTSGSSSDGTQA